MPRETRELLAQAMDLSRMSIDLVANPSIRAYCNATAEITSASGDRITLKYDPLHERELPYLVAHECGHLIRMYSVPAEFRLMPVAGVDHRSTAIYDSGKDVERMSRLGLPDHVLAEIMTFLHQGIVRQVTNFPADFRIERWLRESYPGLQEFQAPALRRQHAEQLKTMKPEVRELTPQRMFRATNAMNAAYGRYIARLLGDRGLFTPYRRSDFAGEGKTLADGIWDTPDRGYYSDVSDANLWGKELGLSGWFEWCRLDEVQDAEFACGGRSGVLGPPTQR